MKVSRIPICVMTLVSVLLTASAQSPPEVIVRRGDTIQWVVGPGSHGPGHKLNFGATGTTPAADVKNMLDFTPMLTAAGESAQSAMPGTVLMTATVKDNAPLGTFIFTCGVHTTLMLSLPFKVEAKVDNQPARIHKIVAEPERNWHLHIDTTP